MHRRLTTRRPTAKGDTLLSGGFFFSNPERIAALLLSRARGQKRGNCPDRITPRLPSSTYAGSLEYENILRSLSLLVLLFAAAPASPRSSPHHSLHLLVTNPHSSHARSFTRSSMLLSAVSLSCAPPRSAPPAAWTTTFSYRFLRHSASRHSCQINNARRRLPRCRRGGRSGIEMRKPPLAEVAHRA